MVSLSAPDGFFDWAGGLLTFFEYVGIGTVVRYSSRQLAIAYDTESLSLERLGPAEEVMAWGSRRRSELSSSGQDAEARHLAVVMLPGDLQPWNLNQLLRDPKGRFVYFLARIGLV